MLESSSVSRRWVWLLPAGLAFGAFALGLWADFIYDDVRIILQDPRIADVGRWGEFWTREYFLGSVDNLYRPITSMSYALQWQLSQRAWPFHLVNLLLYAAGAAMVAALGRCLAGNSVGLVAGLLFAVHPVHSEAVIGIVGRAELLCAVGLFGGAILYLRRPLTPLRALGIIACFILALLSKEQGMLLPPLLLTWGLLRRRQRAADDPPLALSTKERRATQYLALAFCWLIVGYILFREWKLPLSWDRNLLDWTAQPLIRAEGLDRWLLPLGLLGRYARLLVLPSRLSIDYGAMVTAWRTDRTDPYLYVGLLGVLLWLAGAVWAWRRRHAAACFCLIGLALSYAMVGNAVVLIGTNFAERLMYLPSAFFLILLAILLVRLPVRALAPIMVVLMGLALWRDVTYAAWWDNPLRFYQYSLQQQPRSVRLHLLVGTQLLERGDLGPAEEIAAQARALAPEYQDVWALSGLIALKQDRLDDAERYLKQAMKLAPNPAYLQSLLRELEERQAATRPT